MDGNPLIDPKLYEFVDEQRGLNETIRAQGALLPPLETLDPVVTRHQRIYRKDGSVRPPQVDTAYDEEFTTDAVAFRTRVFPQNSERTLIHFHGGGWVLGSIYEQDNYLNFLSNQLNATVVSIDYPLAPETIMPDIISQSTSILKALVYKFKGHTLWAAGESAGANVLLNAVLRLKREGSTAIEHINGMSLCYPPADLSMTPSLRNWGSEFLGLSTDWMEWFIDLATPDMTMNMRRSPDISPLYADLSGLPPTIFSVGELDPLIDDSLFLFARLQMSGSAGELHVYPEAPHGFNGAPTKMAKACNLNVVRFLDLQS